MQDIESSKLQRVSGTGYTPHDVRYALWRCLLAWVFGAAFFAITTGAAYYSFLTKYLHTSDTIYGLIMAAGSVGGVFQLLGSYLVERSGRSKGLFINLCVIHRLIWIGIAGIVLFLPVVRGQSTTVQVALVCLVVFASAITGGIGGAGWVTWMSTIVPKSIAGKFFGNRARFGLIAMVLTGLAVSALLDNAAGKGWVYAVIFGIAALLGVTDILLFLRVKEVPRPVDPQPPSFVSLLVLPWKDFAFRRFALYTVVTWISYSAMGSFTWRFCFESTASQGLGMSVSQANLWLSIVPLIAMAWVALFWGQAIDRFGPKPTLAASSLLQIVIPSLWLFIHPGSAWIIPIVAVLGGLTWPGIDQVTFFMQLKGFPDHRRTAYTAMFLFVFGLAGSIGASLGGFYATFWQHHLHLVPGLPAWVSHYHPLFFTAILIRILAFVFILPHLPMQGACTKSTVVKGIAKEMVTSIPGVNALGRKR